MLCMALVQLVPLRHLVVTSLWQALLHFVISCGQHWPLYHFLHAELSFCVGMEALAQAVAVTLRNDSSIHTEGYVSHVHASCTL